VRTSNKKFYTLLEISDLVDLRIKLEEKRIKWEYACGTLVVMYEKPPEMLEWEKRWAQERAQLPNMYVKLYPVRFFY
jgi:hypothetical protein